MDIYWLKNKEKCGPATVPDVISRIELGELTENTLGWHAGCTKWVPLKELPAMADFLHPAAAEPEEPHSDTCIIPDDAPAETEHRSTTCAIPMDESETPDAPAADKPLPKPPSIVVIIPPAGVRLLARLIDMGAYASVVYLALHLRGVAFHPLLLPSSPLFWLPYVVLEAAVLSTLGTTPGKMLFGMSLLRFTADDPRAPLGFLHALNRSFMVFVGGMGMMFSFLPLLTGLISLWQLKRNGITMWDVRCTTMPTLKTRPSPLRAVLAGVILLCFMHVIGTSLEPWMPDVLRSVQEQSPEMAEWLK